ncbi:hypothetical protein [Falsiroseomonas tokyonensis]|uniref:hypothetical protein n=1 Tax=Falsiroseomonas tokyonensis TaxID=430521 RepID=UPI001C205657|nr:hypothetical protein [Falsiroseomonas tokyonensis]
MQTSYDRASTRLLHSNGSITQNQPANQASAGPVISSLTREEIRRIVLDRIG